MPNPPVTATEDTVTTEIEIAAPPERAFQALIDREQALRWGRATASRLNPGRWMRGQAGSDVSYPKNEAAKAELEVSSTTMERFCSSILPGCWFTAGSPTGTRNPRTKQLCVGI